MEVPPVVVPALTERPKLGMSCTPSTLPLGLHQTSTHFRYALLASEKCLALPPEPVPNEPD